MTFHDLSLRPELLLAVEQLGYTEMTEIQARALPLMLAGRDVAGQAKTGSGKTAAFGLALLQAVDPALRAVQGLVVCPTRELAAQVAAALRQLACRLPNVQVATVSGGRPYRDQQKALQHGCHVVVGTPGRLGKHLRDGNADLGQLRVLALDEADRMLDMGFIDEVMDIVRECPAQRQTLLFSATFPEEIHQLQGTVQREAALVRAAPQVSRDTLRQAVSWCSPEARGQRVAELLAQHRPERALVFCQTRDDTERLAEQLAQDGVWVRALHGLLDQRTRDEVLTQLSQHSISVVVATDVAARGLDVPTLPLVIVAELSPDPEVHLHRIGRTGRAGADGVAVSVVTPREAERLARIEAFLQLQIPEAEPPPALEGPLRLPVPPNRTLLLLLGRQDKIRKGDVLGALVKAGGIPPEAIGDIDLRPRTCAVAVAREHARQAFAAVRRGRIKKKRVRAVLL